MTAIGLILFLFPKLRESKFIKKLLVAFITIGCLVSFFNSNQYLHWKHFDDLKVHILFKQLPHVIAIDKNILHEYVIGIENKYLHYDIKNIELEANSRMPILDSELLLSDCDEKSIDVKIKNSSNLIIKTDILKGGQVLWLSFRCKALLKNNLPEDITYILKSIPIKLGYEIFNVTNLKMVDSGIKSNFSNTKYFDKDIIYNKNVALDHRNNSNKITDYQYCQFSFDNNFRSISVIGTNDGFIKVIYAGLNGIHTYKSTNKINVKNRNVDILRMIVFKNDTFLLESTFEFIKEV